MRAIEEGRGPARGRSTTRRPLTKFMQAAKLDPNMHEAWNYIGYTNRKLGNAVVEHYFSLGPRAIRYDHGLPG